VFQNNEFKDKVVLCSGGSRGIGRAIVTQFVQAGAVVHFFYLRNKTAAQALVQALNAEYPDRVHAHAVDVRDKSQCEHAVNAIIDACGQIDVLVNNSGIVRDNLLVGLEADDIQAVLDTNVTGVFNLCQCVVPFMMRKRRGCIINLSSVSAEKGGQGQTNYAASKGAINAFSKSLAVELSKRNIRVNAVAPGVIETDMSQTVRDIAATEVLDKILLKRFGQPKEVAHLVTFLASDYAAYITGEVVHIDGGFKMA
jgi:3-oxoacyl-[acyl-carrier protein] reductase